MQSTYARRTTLKVDQYFPYKSNEQQVLLVTEVQYAYREVGVIF
jgi:hypothetical protein